MIRDAVLILLLILPAALRAEPARVISGEHGDFTRLVVELPTTDDWRLGRTATGYEFVTTGKTQPAYDLTGVWDRIARARLQALWADPQSGALTLTLACACHAFPYEFRPGMIVIDLRDGPAPPGSAFELALDGSPVPLADRAAVQADAQPASLGVTGYDWLSAESTTMPDRAAALPDLALPTGGISLGPIRDELLEQISRGAAEGVVDMTLPGKPPTVAGADQADLPWSRIRIGELPGVNAGTASQPDDPVQPDGSACLPDADLAIGNWGTDEPGSVQLAKARAGLLGEFDAPDPEAVKQTIRAHLFLGFGAEAMQYAALLDPDPADAEIRLYLDLGRIIDGLESPSSGFSRMLGCDGAAAMWAALLHARLPTGPEVNSAAIARSFAALPPHLRQHFGPELAQKLLDRGDAEPARMIRAATARTPWVPPEEIDLLEAKAGLRQGNLDAAEAHAAAAIAGGADEIEAVLTLIEAGFRKGAPLTPDLADTARSFLNESRGTVQEAGVRRALVLALALSGQAHEAVEAVVDAPLAVSDLWQVLNLRATDDAFLELAVVAEGALPPQTTPEVAMAVASRLVSLGFAEAALVWLGVTDASATAERRLIAARAEQARGDSRKAVDLLQGLDSEAVAALRAEAMAQLGRFDPAMSAYQAAGNDAAAQRLMTWQKDWARLKEDGPEAWKAAAGFVVSDLPAEPGMLAQGSALLQDSQAARQAIADLLATVPGAGEGL